MRLFPSPASCCSALTPSRIDSCGRLGLTPIAYLWERDQRELLGEMVDAGMESLLVKVAGAG